MKEFTVPMALLDFIPVMLFFISSFMMGKDLKKQMGVIPKILYFTGIFFVTAAGFMKALYKLIYAAGAGDIVWLNDQFFSNQAFGFLFAGIGLMFSLGNKSGKKNSVSYALLPVGGLVGIIVVGMGAMYAALCRHAAKLGKHLAVVLIVISYILSLIMGYLSSKDFDSASMNRIAQAINTAAQIFLFCGCMILHRNGIGRDKDSSDDGHGEYV